MSEQNPAKALISDSDTKRAAGEMSLHAPYLDAIQALPGDTPGEKHRWIAQQIQERASKTDDLEEILEYDKFPRALAPLIQVEGVRLQMKAIRRGLVKESKRSLTSYQAIAEALKSEDAEVVNRALQIGEFFDGSNRTITNVTFFFDELFPIVSLCTRQKIVKALASRLSKCPTLAEEFFTKTLSTYGTEQALLLLPACSEPFIQDVVEQRKLRLPRRIVKLMYAKNPDLVAQYLKLLRPSGNFEKISIHYYDDFLAKLIKKRLPAFTEIYEMYAENPIELNLSKSSAEAFWKYGKEYFEKKPRLYIRLLPLKMIDEVTMKRIYRKLLPNKVQHFSTNAALKYLEHYPKEKTASLLQETYKEVYGKDLLENTKNITPALMMILPLEERVLQAKRMIEASKDNPTYPMNYIMIWRCYLLASEAIEPIKKEVVRTPEMEDRAALLCQMFYCCKVNRDDAALLEVLKYWRDRHKNEQSWLHFRLLQCLVKEFKLADWSESLWSVFLDIIKRMYIKNEFTSMSGATLDVFSGALRFRLKNNLPIEPIIEMFVEIKIKGYGITLNVLDDNPDYERKCLEASLAVLEKKNQSDKESWKNEKNDILCNAVDSLYIYNQRHVTKYAKIKVEPLSIRNYPWLLKAIVPLLEKKEEAHRYIINVFERLFSEYEKELHARYWTVDKPEVADVDTGAALVQLQKNPKSILENWDKYLKACRNSRSTVHVRRFIRATRWYKELPIKLAVQCALNIKQEKDYNFLNILAFLLNGHSFTKFLDPLVPVEQSIDVNHENAKMDFDQVYHVIVCMKMSNPPVPLELVSRTCTSDYLSYALMALNNVCRRSSLQKVINFAKTLSSKRVSIRKHGIRVMHMVCSLQQICEFLLTLWKTEEHYSIRQVIFDKAGHIFRQEPSALSWSVIEQIIAGLELKDVSLVQDLLGLVRASPDEYVERYMKLVFAAIDRLAEQGLAAGEVTKHITDLIDTINNATCDILSEEYMQELLKKYLFHREEQIVEVVRVKVIYNYLNCDGEKLQKRLQAVIDILTQVVATEWNVPHSKKSRYFPVNHAVHQLIDRLVLSRTYTESDRIIIQAFYEAYNRLLTPQMDSISYLLLVFGTERCRVETPKEFGVRIGQVVGKLLDSFTPYFMGCISSVLEYYLGSANFGELEMEEVKLSVMEGILEVDTVEALFLCARMLTPVSQAEHFLRHDAIVMTLSKSQHPAIKSILYNFIDKTDASKF